MHIRTFFGFTIGGGVGVAIFVGAGLQPKLDWAIAVQYLFWPYLVPTLCVGLIAVGISLPKLRVVAVGGAITAIVVYLSPFAWDLTANAQSVKPSGHSLKIIAFNWRADNPSFAAVYPWVAQQDPDILSIEEFSENAPGVKDRLYPLFPYHTIAADVIILSRYPISEEPVLQSEDRVVVTAHIDTPEGNLTVIGIHAPTLRTEQQLSQRNAYLITAANFISTKGKYAVVMGDFNATRWDPFFTKLVSAGHLHEQPMIFPGPTRVGLRHKLPGVGSPIDHMLGGSGERLIDCVTGPALGSDHLPLICNLSQRD